MLDNQLIALVIQTIIAQEAVAGIAGTPIKQAFQPTQQGVNTKPTAYMFKVGDHPYGFPLVKDEWDKVNSRMVHTETQQYETTFQIGVLATQSPASPGYTASDIANLVRYTLQSMACVATFEAQGVGIERVTQVRNPAFTDDKARHEFEPSFDFILTHKQIIQSFGPVISGTELQILTV